MSTSTQCPQCNTRFKVSQEQLDARHGMVRCGRCHAAFNALLYLHDDRPSPQLDLLIASEETRQTPIETIAGPATSTHENIGLNHTNTIHAGGQNEVEPAAEPNTLAQRIAFISDLDAPPPKPAKKAPRWTWAIGCLLLSAILLAQAAYFFRTELSATLPGIRPVLTAYCGLLRCTVPLPQKADLMSIESSDLEADPALPNVITLNALLHNRAPYTQSYPNLELTLTDAQDKALARRTFHPAEYLKPGEDEKQGFAANRELGVKLNLDITDLKASGYRLFLF